MGRLRYNRFKKFRQPVGEVWDAESDLSFWKSNGASCLASGGGRIVVAAGPGRTATSVDNGVTWSFHKGLSETAWGTNTVSALTWNGSVFVAGGQDGNIAISKEDF